MIEDEKIENDTPLMPNAQCSINMYAKMLISSIKTIDSWIALLLNVMFNLIIVQGKGIQYPSISVNKSSSPIQIHNIFGDRKTGWIMLARIKLIKYFIQNEHDISYTIHFCFYLLFCLDCAFVKMLFDLCVFHLFASVSQYFIIFVSSFVLFENKKRKISSFDAIIHDSYHESFRRKKMYKRIIIIIIGTPKMCTFDNPHPSLPS